MITITPQAIDELQSMKGQAVHQCGDHVCGDQACDVHSCDMHSHGQHACGHDMAGEMTPSEMALRIIPLPDGRVGLVLDMFRDGDQVVEHDGEKILVVGPELGDSLDGLVFDCVDTESGRQLTMYKADSTS